MTKKEQTTKKKKQSVKGMLNKPLPKNAIKQREGGGGMMLDYLEGWWAIQNANRIFGIGNWSYEPVFEQMKHIILPDTKKGKKTGLYIIPVVLKVYIDGEEIVRSDIGTTQYYGEESKEMAIKGCVTDALKRCLRTFGEQFGLLLYDKGDTTSPTTKIQGKKPYQSQTQLMEKFGMDIKQVSPKCPSCGATMTLVSRKDGSGLFWSCPNWRTKGCKGLNVDDVDINGDVTGKKIAKPVKKEDNVNDDVKVEDLPF